MFDSWKRAQSTVSNDVAPTGLAGDILPSNHLRELIKHGPQSQDTMFLDVLCEPNLDVDP
jgi:hypothetical protein